MQRIVSSVVIKSATCFPTQLKAEKILTPQKSDRFKSFFQKKFSHPNKTDQAKVFLAFLAPKAHTIVAENYLVREIVMYWTNLCSIPLFILVPWQTNYSD